jgi:hypothetical protein
MPIKYYVHFFLAHHVYIDATTCISFSPSLIHAFSGLLPFAYTTMDVFIIASTNAKEASFFYK